jgi:hypothetical protein
MATVNVFRVDNPDGRVDVGRAVGSKATAMFIYDLAPGRKQSRITTSTRRSGSWSLTAPSCCAGPMGSTTWYAETSSVSHPVLPGLIRC